LAQSHLAFWLSSQFQGNLWFYYSVLLSLWLNFNIYDFMFYTSVILQLVYTTYMLHWNGWNHLDRLSHTCVMSHDPRHTTAAEKTIIWCSDSLRSWWGCPKGMWLQNWGFGNNLAKLCNNLIIIWQLFGKFGN
jgi:hypothetical protein